VLALAGAAGGATTLALAGAVAAGAGVVVLMASGLLSAALVIAVAAPLPALYTSGTTRLATVAPVAAGALVAWIIRRGVDRGSLQLGALPRRALLLLVGAFILATLLADDVALSARETLNFLLLAGLLLAITDELTSRPALRTQLVDLLVLSAGACGVLGVMEGWASSPETSRAGGRPSIGPPSDSGSRTDSASSLPPYFRSPPSASPRRAEPLASSPLPRSPPPVSGSSRPSPARAGSPRSRASASSPSLASAASPFASAPSSSWAASRSN
jgi:hypothetical protein